MSLPVGTVVGMIGVNPKSPPTGWLYCDGSTFDGITYPELAKVFPNNTLPNLVGLTLMGASSGGPYPASSLGFGNGSYQNQNGTYGSAQHTLAVTEMPSHQHFGFGEAYGGWPFGELGAGAMGSNGGVDNDNYYYGTTFTGGTDSNTSTQQPNNPFPLIQPSYAIYFFINATSAG
ncbi:MAG TPA: tail fiber protein [Pseudolabrys sp.]|nr:tail fiber protein [Pseudolabrys sp.]